MSSYPCISRLRQPCAQFPLSRGGPCVVSDGDVIRLPGGLVGSRDVQNTVSINVEGDFNLWNTMRSGRNPRELKFAEQIVILGASTLSFVNLNEYIRLVIGVSYCTLLTGGIFSCGNEVKCKKDSCFKCEHHSQQSAMCRPSHRQILTVKWHSLPLLN